MDIEIIIEKNKKDFKVLKNNSVDALHNYIFNLTSNNLQVYLLLGIIILILLFNIKIL